MNIKKMQKLNNRNSNIEVLRIVAMSTIVLSHFMGHAIHLTDTNHSLYQIINPFLSCGVNIFFLISGYFQIKFSFKSLLKFIWMVMFFRIVNLIFLYCITQGVTMMDMVKSILFPVSSSSYWFLKVYMGLIIISPIICAGFKSISERTLLNVSIVFSVFTFYSCFIGKNMINPTGFTLIQGLFCYTLGQIIYRKQSFINKIPTFVSLIGAFVVLVLTVLIYKYFNFGAITNYNSPFCVFASILLFIGFLRFKFSNKYVNSIAGASVGVYMLQDGDFGFLFLYDWLNEIWYSTLSLGNRIGIFASVFIGLWLISWVVFPLYNKLYISVIYPNIKPITKLSIFNFTPAKFGFF